MSQVVELFVKTNKMKLTEPNTPLDDADHVGSFDFKENVGW
jgi:hypothetical protein